ncbi:hypothetical protein JCM8208_004282 [Rhodotorula glutinis]
MPASYASLPDELISHIADMVHAQDGAFDQLAIKRGSLKPSPPADTSDSEEDEHESKGRTSVIEGRWSPAYGRGIPALVQVDRRTRSHALKHLYKSIAAKQAAADYCRYAILGEDVGNLVQEVDLDLGQRLPVDPFSLACALRKLKNLKGLVVDDIPLELAFPDEREEDEARKLLGLSILDALGRVKTLSAMWLSSKLLSQALGGTRAATLSRLSLDGSTSSLELTDAVVAALNGLKSLVDFQFDMLSSLPSYRARMQECVPLERVRTLTLVHTRFEAGFREALVLAHHIAPRARTLNIMHSLISPPAAPPAGSVLPDPLLPALRVLDVQHAQHYIAAFHEIRLPALEHFSLSLDGPVSVFPYQADYLPPTATALRTITLSYPSLKRLSPPADLLARCADLSIHLSTHRRLASPALFTHARRLAAAGAGEHAVGVVAPSRSQALALEETLTWARNRARWLRETGDGPGLQELAEAALRLRERHLVHES